MMRAQREIVLSPWFLRFYAIAIIAISISCVQLKWDFGIWDEAKIGKEKRVRLSSAMVLCHVYHKIATSHASVIF